VPPTTPTAAMPTTPQTARPASFRPTLQRIALSTFVTDNRHAVIDQPSRA
jgi:hypothetical protein